MVGFVVGHFVASRICLIARDEGLDLRAHRGGEQHDLAVRRGAIQKPAHRREKSHVGHTVRLVDDDRSYSTKVDGALGDQVLETTRAGHNGVHSPSQGLAGGLVSRPPVNGDHASTALARQQRKLALDLRSELAGGDEDQSPGPSGFRSAGPAHHRQSESQRLARPRRGAAAHVTPRQDVGKCRLLDGERACQPPGHQMGHQIGAHP